MDGNKGTVFGIFLVVGCLCLIAVVCTCGLGVFVVMPYMAALYAVVYLSCSGQPTLYDVRNMQYQMSQTYVGEQPQQGGD